MSLAIHSITSSKQPFENYEVHLKKEKRNNQLTVASRFILLANISQAVILRQAFY